MEFFADEDGGKPALGVRNVKGTPSAMLFTPSFDCPSGACRLRFEYQTARAVRDNQFHVKFKPDGKVPAWAVVDLPGTGDGWRAEDLPVDLRGVTRGFFEFHNSAAPPAAARLRGLTIVEVGTAPGGPAPAPSPDDISAWAAGEVVYSLDPTTVPAFRVQKEKQALLSGDPEHLPAGVGCQAWRDRAVAEFRCEPVDGVPALTVTNLNDQKSGQFYFNLEGAIGARLEPGKAYRVAVDYATKNEAAGVVNVQVTPGFKGLASARLPNTGGKWKTAVVNFTRPPAADRVEVRFTIDNESVGEGNALCVRAVEVAELVPPGKK
jgi:hypothetical protein